VKCGAAQFTAVAASMTQELLPSFLPSRMRLKEMNTAFGGTELVN